MTTQAQAFIADYSDTTDLMGALDDAGVDSEQDWENESTVWTFEDDSKITVSGPFVEVN